MKTFKKLALVSIVSLAFLACNKTDVSCDNCQSAIQHMCDKIAQNNCNPDFMENALNRLQEDCGSAAGNIYAGYMSHTCLFETALDCPSCMVVDDNFSTGHLSVTNTEFNVNSDKDNTDTLTIILTKDEPHPNGSIVIIKSNVIPGDNIFNTTNLALYNGTEIHVNVFKYDPENTFDGTGDLLVTQSADFKFYRPGRWEIDRIANVSIDPTFNDYRVDFEYW